MNCLPVMMLIKTYNAELTQNVLFGISHKGKCKGIIKIKQNLVKKETKITYRNIQKRKIFVEIEEENKTEGTNT